jgi:mannosylglycerate hydrolase
VAILFVPHTHWDREWYRPFQSFRISLVVVVDEVLELLEADERYRFTLDGQLATVDDYLEIRPENEGLIRALVAAGRLAIGPWQTLVDEFLVSGESIVRNLETGLARAEELGGAMRHGYLPDMFGHIAQMPQILRSHGIETAIVWRGVPAAVETHTFTWEGQDGSTVHGEYLPEGGYSNAAWIWDGRPDGLEELEERLRPWFGDDRVLAMVGTDHMPPVRDLPDRIPDDAEIGTLADYFAPNHPLQQTVTRLRGELRSAARANLLPGVVSARIDLKAACARAERALERYAEPLQALYGGEWPEPFLRIAWSRILQNAAHDSICGCSVDEVSAQVLVRYAEAEQIGRELAIRAVARVATEVPAGAVAVVNPSPHERADLVELELPIPAEWDAVVLETPDGTFLPTQEIGERLDAQRRRLVAAVPAPPLGWTSVRAVSGSAEASDPVEVDGTLLRNGLVEWDAATLRLVDGGDFGDSYNYAPPAHDLVVTDPVDERVEVVEPGPLRARLLIHRTYLWPRGIEPDGSGRSTETVAVPVELEAELRTGEPFVRFRIALDNPCDDHRLRVHVPLGETANRTFGEGQFAIVERPAAPEGGHGEEPVGTYPASAFVAAGGTALLLDHVSEYELVGGRELALTVLRSIGLISRTANPYRREPAGPELSLPAAQLHGPRSFSFALLPHAGSPVEQAEHYRHPFLTGAGTGNGDMLRTHAGPGLTGKNVVLSSLRRLGGSLEARLVNENPTPMTARLGDVTAELRPWEIRTVSIAER